MSIFKRKRINQLYRNHALADLNPDGTMAECIKNKDHILAKELNRYFRRGKRS